MSRIASLLAKIPRVVFAVIGILLVCYGQIILQGMSSDNSAERLVQAITAVSGIIGALLFGVAFARDKIHPLPRLEFPLKERVTAPAIPWLTPWAIVWFIVALVLSGVSIYIFATTGEDRTVILIWLASIFVLFVGQWWDVRIMLPKIAPERRLPLAALVLVLLVALISRTYQLTTLPYNVDGDFASVGLQARELVTGAQPYIFANGWAAIPMLGYLPPWITMSVWGTGLAGLNASGVIEGLLIIVGVYLLGRDLFNARVGLFAAVLLTISYTHLAASRQSSYIDPVVFMLYAIYFLLIGLREGRGWAMLTSGVLTALCIQMYYSGRLVIFVVAFILLYMLLFRRTWLFGRIWGLILWGAAVLVTTGPMLVVFLGDLDSFMSRTREVFILTPEVIVHMQSVYNVDSVSAMLLEHARRSLFILNYYIDKSTQYSLNLPFLDPFAAVLFILGVGFSLFRWRWVGYITLLGWALLALIVGCFLTANAPFWPRLLVLLPPTALLGALAFNQMYVVVRRALERIDRRVALVAPVAATCVFVVVGVLNWNSYVAAKKSFATPRTSIGRYMAEQPLTARGYVISDDFRYMDREFDFLSPGKLVANLTPEDVDAGNIQQLGSPTLFILSREQREVLERLQQMFPEGSAETIVGNSATEVAFYAFRLPE